MKKSIILLLSFCLVFCVICTACAKIPQNTDGSSEPTKSTSYKKPYEVCYTSVRETKALKTEASELQQKIDWNYEMTYNPKVQQKVLINFGDQRDVPYLFRNGNACYVKQDDMVITDPDFTVYSFSNLQAKEAFMPVYTYTGTEEFSLELNDEPYPMVEEEMIVRAQPLDGSEEQIFRGFREMYEELPKGKYYVYFDICVYGNDIVFENGEIYGREYKTVTPSFVLELK